MVLLSSEWNCLNPQDLYVNSLKAINGNFLIPSSSTPAVDFMGFMNAYQPLKVRGHMVSLKMKEELSSAVTPRMNSSQTRADLYLRSGSAHSRFCRPYFASDILVPGGTNEPSLNFAIIMRQDKYTSGILGLIAARIFPHVLKMTPDAGSSNNCLLRRFRLVPAIIENAGFRAKHKLCEDIFDDFVHFDARLPREIQTLDIYRKMPLSVGAFDE
ncbi:hypothetical protein TNCV_3873541 [Trichonephila clavipes]|nr:hypothetical protein TNCV_3873541 [Trichonephila clavipes]